MNEEFDTHKRKFVHERVCLQLEVVLSVDV